MTQDPRHPGGFEPYQNTNYGDQTMAAPKTSIAAVVALISGAVSLIPCVGLLTAPIAFISGIIGFFTAGKPSVKGRWMAVLGLVLALLGGGYNYAGAVWAGAKGVGVAKAVAGFEESFRTGDFSAIEPYTDMTKADFDRVQADLADIGTVQSINIQQTGTQSSSSDGSVSYQEFRANITGTDGTKDVIFTVELPIFGGGDTKLVDIQVE